MIPTRDQQTALCQHLTAHVPRGPYWTDSGPTDAAVAVLENESPLSRGEHTMVLFAWAIWNAAPPFGRLMQLDDENLRRVAMALAFLGGVTDSLVALVGGMDALVGGMDNATTASPTKLRSGWREQYAVGQRVQIRTFKLGPKGYEPNWRGAKVTRVPERVGDLVRGRLLVMLDKGSEMEPKSSKSIRPEPKE